jgi:lipopolysaccharide biosynthesis glycosyltransferase
LNSPSTVLNARAERSASRGLCPIVLACDEGYAMPLATTLRSLADNNTKHWPLLVTILHDGFRKENKEMIARSVPDGAIELIWKLFDLSEFIGFSHRMPWVSPMTYARLKIQNSLDSSFERVLFLDTDILVLDDLGALAWADLGGQTIGAVPDAYVDPALRKGQRRPEHSGVPLVAGYFNAGVLVVDLVKWRANGIAERATQYLAEHPNLPYGDQDALNATCDGLWARLPDRWNFQLHHTTRIAILPPHERPAIVHFITQSKPWKASSTSINAKLYNRFRDRTVFRRTGFEKLWNPAVMIAYRLKHRLIRTIGGRVKAG